VNCNFWSSVTRKSFCALHFLFYWQPYDIYVFVCILTVQVDYLRLTCITWRLKPNIDVNPNLASSVLLYIVYRIVCKCFVLWLFLYFGCIVCVFYPLTLTFIVQLICVFWSFLFQFMIVVIVYSIMHNLFTWVVYVSSPSLPVLQLHSTCVWECMLACTI